MPEAVKMALRGSAIMVRQLDKTKQLHGIFEDLYSNDIWVSSFASYLNDSINKNETQFTPGQILASTTLLIVGQRYLINNAEIGNLHAQVPVNVEMNTVSEKPKPQYNGDASSESERHKIEMEKIARSLG